MMEPVNLDGEPCDGDGCHRAARNGGERRQAVEGQRLCAACRSLLAEAMRELPRLYAECGAVLGSGAASGLREKITGGPAPGLVLNDFAAEARMQILTTLASWSGLVTDQRRVPAPARQVAVLADFLLANLTWLLSHPVVADASAEMARTVTMARRAAYPDSVKRIVVGSCVLPDCDGVLTATVRASRAGAGTRVRCGVDPEHTWDGSQWTRLRREMRQSAPAEERWLAAADIARLWSTPTGTVYRLASEQSWRRITRDGRTYYAENDVHGSFSRRKARVTQQE
jgi:hypothetical protein